MEAYGLSFSCMKSFIIKLLQQENYYCNQTITARKRVQQANSSIVSTTTFAQFNPLLVHYVTLRNGFRKRLIITLLLIVHPIREKRRCIFSTQFFFSPLNLSEILGKSTFKLQSDMLPYPYTNFSNF